MKYFKCALLLPLFYAFCACSNAGGGTNSANTQPSPGPSRSNSSSCTVDLKVGASHLEIAIAFNEFRERCQPSTEQLEMALKNLDL